MGAGAAPLVLGVPFNKAVVADAGFVFEKLPGHLAGTLKHLMSAPSEVSKIARRARARAAEYFTWNSVVAKHAELFHGLSCGESAKAMAQEPSLESPASASHVGAGYLSR
jgi:glycosyltransferase involved in cell wall biosynthesis